METRREAIRAQANALGVEAVGFARLDPDWFYDGHDRPWRTIIVLGLAMDYEVYLLARIREEKLPEEARLTIWTSGGRWPASTRPRTWTG